MRKLDPNIPEDLQQMLHSGMGRAIQFLMKQDSGQYRDVILDACLHNYAYDRQCDNDRCDYLYPLLKVSKEKDYYRNAILQALPNAEDSYDAGQLLDFAVLFAREGDEQARNAIYDKIQLNNTSEELTGDHQIIELDGIAGLIFCLELIGSDPNLMKTSYDCEYIINTTENITSIDEVRLALQTAAYENSAVAKALANMQDYSPYWTVDEIINKRKERPIGWNQLKSSISEETTWNQVKNNPKFIQIISRWALIASDIEFEKAAIDLDPEANQKLLAIYLRLFHRRKYPLEPSKLIQLVNHPNETVANWALNALEIIHHPDVRALFKRIVLQPELSDHAIGLLRSNYEIGDDNIITYFLEKETNQDNLHTMCSNVNDVYKDNPIPEGIEPLLSVYEKTPCSLCRHRCVETIQAIGEIPAWMIDECKYDSDSGTRKLAENLASN